MAALNPQRTALVINPAAGRREADLEALRARFGDAMPAKVYETSPERDADHCARDALAWGADVVVAAGGDGTVSLVASALVGTRAALGVLPLGTANSVADALGIPADLDGALAVLRDGAPRRIDTARANGRTMVLTAMLGAYADAIGSTERASKNRWGVLAYVASGLEKLAALAPFQVELVGDDRVVHCEATAVTVANMAPRQSVLAQGPAVIDYADGLLDVTIVAASGVGDALAAALHLFRTAGREPASRDGVGFFSVRRVVVRAAPAQRTIIDGEDAGEGSLTVECLPSSLAVIAPPPVAAEAREGPVEREHLEGLPGLDVHRASRA